MAEVTLVRANKVTAYWEGDGVAIGQFYKTHEKVIPPVKSTDPAVITAGFVFPEGTEEAPATAAQKLDAFKTFLSNNSTVFGVTYDPIDRRADAYKYPSKYDQPLFTEFSKKMAQDSIVEVLQSVQSSVIDKMIKAGNLPSGTAVQFGVDEPTIAITETYANGGLKYANAVYPVVIAVSDKRITTSMTIELVSGQIKKPRTIGDGVLTMTGIKTMLVDAGVLPKIEPKSEKTEAATGDAAPDAPGAAAQA